MGITSISRPQIPPFEQRSLPLGEGLVADHHSLVIWLVDIDSASLTLGINAGQLARQEKINQRRFSQKFYTRLILGAYLNKPAAEIKISHSLQGKPYLDFKPGQERLYFNLSHSQGWLLLALSRAQEVGVDIECQRQNKQPLKLAERYFSVAETEYLRQFSGPALQQQFKRLWVRKEAALKCMGSGLAGNLASTISTLANPDNAGSQQTDRVLLNQTNRSGNTTELEILSFEHPDNKIIAAVALPRLPKKIYSYQLNCQRKVAQ